MNCLTKKKKKNHWQFSRVFQHHRSGKYPKGQFPHFRAEEAQPGVSEYPVHGHTANECVRQEERLSLQGLRCSTPNISTGSSQAAQTQGPPTYLA